MTFDELVIFYITLIGCTAKELTIGVDITGVQTAPSTTAITSHIN